VTGHNGFVGSWLCSVLARSDAEVIGLSLRARECELAELLGLDETVTSIEGDVRDPEVVDAAVRDHRPEVVLHLAAQALVIPSFDDPVGTFATNVLGTAHVLDAVRRETSVKSVVIVTSDKCYATGDRAHIETDPLGGDDPYSASKGAAEIVTHAFRSSLIPSDQAGIASARAGNIIGGGDFSEHRILPDCVRAVGRGAPVRLRNPRAIRPWQHVLDAVAGYLRLGAALLEDATTYSVPWNFGPDENSPASVADVVAIFLDRWRDLTGVEVAAEIDASGAFVPERPALILSSERARAQLGWRPELDLRESVIWSADWYRAVDERPSVAVEVTEEQIERFLRLGDRSRPAGAEKVLVGR
jgi:CDP-glucose 4,6-dehydratase